jgi:hypothetical protein
VDVAAVEVVVLVDHVLGALGLERVRRKRAGAGRRTGGGGQIVGVPAGLIGPQLVDVVVGVVVVLVDYVLGALGLERVRRKRPATGARGAGGGGQVVGVTPAVVPPQLVDVVIGEAEVDDVLGALEHVAGR